MEAVKIWEDWEREGTGEQVGQERYGKTGEESRDW